MLNPGEAKSDKHNISFTYRDHKGQKQTYSVLQRAKDLGTQHNLSQDQKELFIACLRYTTALNNVSILQADFNKFAEQLIKKVNPPKPAVELRCEDSGEDSDSRSEISDNTLSPPSSAENSLESSVESEKQNVDEPVTWPALFHSLAPKVQQLWAAAPEATLVEELMRERAIAEIKKISVIEAANKTHADNQREAKWITIRDQFNFQLAQTPEKRFLEQAKAKSKDEYTLLPEVPSQELIEWAKKISLTDSIEIDKASFFHRHQYQQGFWVVLAMSAEDAYWNAERKKTNKAALAEILGYLLFVGTVIGYCAVSSLKLSMTVALGVIGVSVPMFTLIASVWLYNTFMHADGPSCSTGKMLGGLGGVGVTAVGLVYGVLPLFLSGAAVAAVSGFLWPVAIGIGVCILAAWIGTQVKGARMNQPSFFKKVTKSTGCSAQTDMATPTLK